MKCTRCLDEITGPHCSSCCRSFADQRVFRAHRQGDECADPVLAGLHYDNALKFWRRAGDRAA